MNLQETKAKLEKYNQSQLLKYYDELDEKPETVFIKADRWNWFWFA